MPKKTTIQKRKHIINKNKTKQTQRHKTRQASALAKTSLRAIIIDITYRRSKNRAFIYLPKMSHEPVNPRRYQHGPDQLSTSTTVRHSPQPPFPHSYKALWQHIKDKSAVVVLGVKYDKPWRRSSASSQSCKALFPRVLRQHARHVSSFNAS